MISHQGVDRYPKSRVDAHHVLANWKQDPRNLVRLTGDNDGVQFTNLAMSEQEITTQQQQTDTQEETEAAPESEGTTLATITTRAPTAGASGRGWGPGGRGAGRGHRQGGARWSPVSAVGNMATIHQSVMQQMKKYNDIVQANCQQQKTIPANNYYTQVFLRMTPTTTSQLVGSSTKLILSMTILTLRPDMGDGFQWSGYYWIINPPLMCSLIVASSGTSGGSTNTCISIAQLWSPKTNLVGELPGYGTVWFHPDGITNILSLSRVKTKYRITFDSDENNEFIVHKPDGSTHNFKESSRGLYYLDRSTGVTGVVETGMALVTTLANNASNYTHADYSHALLARKHTTDH